ncbi:CDP-glycerol glycerophosphotransferase family protein [Spongiactinospora sp. TRM90649]|uniref:bifunctional glycosyltransferase/CDP-glycerol:glycerophosphate glycerophosphotransferase n=1 Tax=Spongiactinospora sp. TRM90649 TaxID=3031114 RepID=UPI0023F8A1B5|nr:CDP-glycerol glycerophosphotransferase family protein [Spongiactinospora sp. TRM90649]MDF5751391.1 CDP-glycerol glycerophosphotransferase family protein [Spongiactinospora sp. TRM90649]
MPDCTVVVIAYNDAARLPRAVRSVLGQTLRGVEVIIVDDASTDDTPQVTAALCAEDPRVRVIRRAANSGGCGAPRNDGMAAATAPFVMFLDSDDTLPRHSCKSLLAEIERTGADFVTGQVRRVYEWDRKPQCYFPSLYRRRVVEGIRKDPEMFLDTFSTNKLYRTAFLREHDLRFEERIHFEDHIFTARLFCASRCFAVVPWVVYDWHRAPDRPGVKTSISLRLRQMDNVRQRVRAAWASDVVLMANGFADLIPERQRRFLRQDIRVYLNPLPSRDRVWVKEFASVVRPYLAEIKPDVYAGVDAITRVCCRLIIADRIEELEVAARSMSGPRAAPRRAVRQDGRTYWGAEPDPGLDITSLRMAELPFTASRLRHEVTEMSVSGTALSMTIRTYDPFHVLDANPGWHAELRLRHGSVRLAPALQDDGGYLSEVTVDLRKTVSGPFGHDGSQEPRIAIVRPDGRKTTDRLLVEPTTPPIEVRVPGHTVTLRADGQAAVLRVRWRREGLRRQVPRLARLARRVLRTAADPRLKLGVYHGLIRLLPRRPDLAVFEADVGKGYTGNPRYIYEEVRRRGLPISAVWSASRRRTDFPADVPLVRRMSWRYVWTLARAAYWVDSHGFPLDFPKPRGTRYLQTWHGQGIKTIGYNAPDLRGDFDGPRRQWRSAVARWDALVSPGEEFERTFLPSNGYGGPVLRYGSPRCDVLVNGDPAAARRVRDRLEIPDGRRVLLYAPTYRDSAKYSGASVRADLVEMAEALSDEWVLVLRTHPVERFTVPQHVRHFVRPAGSYPEVNDLMLAADALITDYSSLMCDFAVTGKPMLFLIDDWDEYRRTERGAYYDLPAIAPGPCVTTTSGLIEAVRELGPLSAAFAAKYARFREMWCADERGEAAARVVDAFFERRPVGEKTPVPR